MKTYKNIQAFLNTQADVPKNDTIKFCVDHLDLLSCMAGTVLYGLQTVKNNSFMEDVVWRSKIEHSKQKMLENCTHQSIIRRVQGLSFVWRNIFSAKTRRKEIFMYWMRERGIMAPSFVTYLRAARYFDRIQNIMHVLSSLCEIVQIAHNKKQLDVFCIDVTSAHEAINFLHNEYEKEAGDWFAEKEDDTQGYLLGMLAEARGIFEDERDIIRKMNLGFNVGIASGVLLLRLLLEEAFSPKDIFFRNI